MSMLTITETDTTAERKTITFEQIRERVARHYGQPSAPVEYHPAAVSLTDRGNVAIAISRLRAQLRRLDAEDRADALAQIREMLGGFLPRKRGCAGAECSGCLDCPPIIA